MNAKNNITIAPISIKNTKLPLVIASAIGEPVPNKVSDVIKSYDHPDNSIIGAFIGDILIGVLGFCKEKASKIITIRHISVLTDYQRQGIGTLLLDEIKKLYTGYKIIAETDSESVDFYAKLGFACHEFKGKYANSRYSCEFNL